MFTKDSKIGQAVLNAKTSLGPNPAIPYNLYGGILGIIDFEGEKTMSNTEFKEEENLSEKMSQLTVECAEIETKISEMVVTACENIISSMFDIPKGAVTIEMGLHQMVDTSWMRKIPDREDFSDGTVVDVKKNAISEIYKRRMLLSLCAGAAAVISEKNGLYERFSKLNKELPKLYSRLNDIRRRCVYTDSLNYCAAKSGAVSVMIGSEDTKPVISAEGCCAPILVEMAIRGILELSISTNLPKDIEMRKIILGKSDFAMADKFDLMFGIPLWKRIVRIVERLGYKINNIGANFLLMELSKMTVRSFNTFFNELFNDDKHYMVTLNDICRTITENKEYDTFNNFIKEKSEKFKINDDYMTKEELLESINVLNEIAITKDKLYEKYYNDIPKDVFDAAVKADPTSDGEIAGKYIKWILNLARKGKWKKGDISETNAALKLFNKFSKSIEKRDINAYGSISDLWNTVKQFTEKKTSTDIKREGAEKVYEDSDWLVIVPHTEDAAIQYGKATKWCTSAEKTENMFDFYNQKGPLYIYINKSNGRKYQLHYETDSLMDEKDEETDILSMGLNKNALRFLINNNAIKKIQTNTGNKIVIFGENEFLYNEEKGIISKNYDHIDDFHEGLAKVTDNDVVNFIDINGKEICDVWFNDAHWFENGVCLVLNDEDKEKFLKKDGKTIPNFWVDEIYKAHSKKGIHAISNNNKWNYIDNDGKLLSHYWFKEAFIHPWTPTDDGKEYFTVEDSKSNKFLLRDDGVLCDKISLKPIRDMKN